MSDHPNLYHKGKKDALYSWRIWVEGSDILTEHGLVDGKKQISRKTATPKNVGKSNETTAEEQAALEAAAMWVFKKDRKYSETPEEAETTLFLPMLAKDFYKALKHAVYPCDVQPKLDGVRCLASWDGDEVVLTSRSGKPYDVAHIKSQLAEVLPRGTVLDGEIYLHDVGFQNVTRLVKKYRPGESEALEYWVYDMPKADHMPEDSNWAMRKEALAQFWATVDTDKTPRLIRTPTNSAESQDEVEELQGQYMADGYEGAIVRTLQDYPYIFGYRSNGLLKVKSFMDEEFKIVGYDYGVGKMAEVPTWVCELPDGNTFRCVSKGSMEYRKSLGENPGDFVGQMLRVVFFEKSEDGVPRFPVGDGFRMTEDMS